MHLHTYIVVDNLRENNFTTDTITVLWNATPGDSGPVVDCGPVVNYVVTAVNSPDADDMRNVTVKEEEATISNLDKGTTYTITVVAVNRAGSGPPSTINVTTDKGKVIMFNVHNSTNMFMNGTAPKQHCKCSEHMHIHSLATRS